ncbi:MobQ family relaxase [Scytonema sp. HK-05]|uniref:MobQ family relaxase n=1 Tax=Scytonema sp. HK-05 TaxID=1137095 RepID=UPI000936B6CA|nr:MobQ family relaxase [Scytonema sp. HK-05]OKH42763.1 hypothetical protein NIES2130_39555 [Scytonema sp. HK-05]
MALYNYDSRVLGRSNGDTAVSYAAYCSAEELYDHYYGKTRRFGKADQHDRIYAKGIMAPADAADWVYDREKLWNKVEQAEKRKDSQLCREIIISLPRELNHEQKQKLIKRYVQEQFVVKGMVADVSLHNFEGKDSHNPHAHILLTTRRVDGERFALKKEESWRPKMVKDAKTRRVIVDPEYLKQERQQWENYCNHALELAGRDERVDCRSLKDRGIDKIPAPKLGKAHAMEQRPEWKGKTRAGNEHRAVKELNNRKRQLQKLEQEKASLEKEIEAEKKLVILEVAQQKRQEQKKRTHQTAKNIAETLHQKPAPPQQKQPINPSQELTEDERELLRQWQEYHERERSNKLSRDEQSWEPER